MAKGTKELKSRIRGVRNIKQITRAMEMVATTKLKKLQERAAASRPYADKIQEMVGRLAGMPGMENASPLMESREVKKVAVIMVTSDKGLCGAYNSNIIRMTVQHVAENTGPEYNFNLFGKKGFLYLKRRPYTLDYRYDGSLEKISYTDVKGISRNLESSFNRGEIDEARIFYTRFVSTMTQRPTVQQLLPISKESLLGEAEEGESRNRIDFLLEPSPKAIFQGLLPKFLEVKIYSALMESLASEYAARRVAMKAATDASDDMIDALLRQYNRARQETITKELLEVVSGAEALK
ncbi:MAG: ATP synthase F1 subunit gamma [Planctomycetes bacterium]|nr:ATP synthase F1 subunit gamma [Planctomycetota bacterium]